MARRTRRTSTRSYGAPRSRSRSYGARSSGSYRAPRRSSRSSSRRTANTGRTVRIVIEQAAPSAIARPDLIGKMPIVGLTRNRSRF